MLTHDTIAIGDTACFPAGRLGDYLTTRHRFEVRSFRPDGCVTVARLHDGYERTISIFWFERYRTLETETAYYARKPHAGNKAIDRSAKLAAIRRRRLREVTLQTDPNRPGYYVSALSRGRHALILGPFVDHYDALLLRRVGRQLIQTYDLWSDIAIGTCQTADSRKPGKFNAVLNP